MPGRIHCCYGFLALGELMLLAKLGAPWCLYICADCWVSRIQFFRFWWCSSSQLSLLADFGKFGLKFDNSMHLSLL